MPSRIPPPRTSRGSATAAPVRSCGTPAPHPDSMSDTALKTLNEVFGYERFRGDQAVIIDAVLAGRDALVLMPTGGGKSLCYQIPALMRDGAGLVVSPLIALMQDQVQALN